MAEESSDTGEDREARRPQASVDVRCTRDAGDARSGSSAQGARGQATRAARVVKAVRALKWTLVAALAVALAG